jgi:hypothetical protein
MADRPHVDTYLMGTPTVDAHCNQSAQPCPRTLDRVIGARWTAIVAAAHPRPVGGITADRSIDAAAQFPRDSVNQCTVALVNTPLGKLRRKHLVAAVTFRNKQDATGLLIKAVDNPRPFDATDPTQAPAAMVQDAMHQGIISGSRTGMHHNPGRFVDHQQLFILKQHIKVHWYRDQSERPRPGNRVLNDITAQQARGLANHLIIPPDHACCQHALPARPAPLRVQPGKHLVGSVGSLAFRNLQLMFGGGA